MISNTPIIIFLPKSVKTQSNERCIYMKYQLVIWDFNGTVINDVDLCINSLNTLLRRRNMPTADTKEAYHKLFRFPIKDYYIAAGFDFEKESYETLAHEWIAEFLAGEPYLKTYDGVKETMAAIKDAGIQQIVLSSSEKAMLERQISQLGLSEYFDTILGLDNIYAGGKIEMAKQWAGEDKLHHALMIGDTTHDYDVATAIGADCILFSGGHNSRTTLEQFGVPVIDAIPEILNYIK